MNIVILQESHYKTIIDKIDALYDLISEKKLSSNSVDELLTTTEAAKRLKVCNKTVINHIESGKLKAIKFNKGEGKRGHFKVQSSELEKFIKVTRLGY